MMLFICWVKIWFDPISIEIFTFLTKDSCWTEPAAFWNEYIFLSYTSILSFFLYNGSMMNISRGKMLTGLHQRDYKGFIVIN